MKIVEERIKAEIEAEPITKKCRIVVGCSEGTVVLNGNVSTYYQKQMVQEAARRVIDKKIPYLALTLRNDVIVD